MEEPEKGNNLFDVRFNLFVVNYFKINITLFKLVRHSISLPSSS